MCLIWGIPYLLIKVAVRDFSPAGLVFVRTAIGAVVLVPVAGLRGQLLPALCRWPMLLAYTVVELGVPWLLLSDAERHVSSSLTGLLVAGVPLVGAVLAPLFGQPDRLDGWRVAGLLIGVGGVAVLLGLSAQTDSPVAIGELAVVIVGYAVGPLIATRWLADVPGLGVVAASLALCAVGYAPMAIPGLPVALPPWPVLASILLLGLVCTAVAFVVFFGLIAEIGPARATVFTFVNPAVAVLLGVAVLGEPFTASTAVGFALILTGSVLATRPSRAAPDGPAQVPVPAARLAASRVPLTGGGPRRGVRGPPLRRRPR